MLQKQTASKKIKLSSKSQQINLSDHFIIPTDANDAKLHYQHSLILNELVKCNHYFMVNLIKAHAARTHIWICTM